MAKNYLILGASSGMGLALTKCLLADADKIFAMCRSKENIPSDQKISFFELNIEDKEPSFPQIDDPIHGLAYFPGSIDLKPFSSLHLEDFVRDMEINLYGAVKTIQAYLQNLKKAEKSSILLVSTVAVKVGMPFHASISAAKGAIEGLGRSLAAELAPAIRVNIVAPSITETRMSKSLIKDENKKQTFAKRHPMQSVGSPEDIAKMASFLLSDNSKWITGQTIHVDGGLSSLRLF